MADVAEQWFDLMSYSIEGAMYYTLSGHKMSNGFHFRWRLLLQDLNWALWRATVSSEAFTQWKCHLSHALIICRCSVHQLCVTLWVCALAAVMPCNLH